MDRSKFKAFACDILQFATTNIAGKAENAGYQNFLFFPECFQKPSLSGTLQIILKDTIDRKISNIYEGDHLTLPNNPGF